MDRGKSGAKRSLLVEGGGVPVGLSVAGANRNDFKLLEATLQNIPVARPKPTRSHPQPTCLDKGYDYDEVRAILQAYGCVAHIRSRGEEAQAKKKRRAHQARRWVVERTHSWFNRFRGILTRRCKKAANYQGMLCFVCSLTAYRAAGLFGQALSREPTPTLAHRFDDWLSAESAISRPDGRGNLLSSLLMSLRSSVHQRTTPSSTPPLLGCELPAFVRDLLASVPKVGEGIDGWFFRVAHVLHPYRQPEEIEALLRAATHGERIRAGQIERAVANSKAAAWQPDASPESYAPAPKWLAVDMQKQREAMAGGPDAAELCELSPLRLETGEPDNTAKILQLLFSTLKVPDPLLCIGKSNTVFATRPLSEWCATDNLADHALVPAHRPTFQALPAMPTKRHPYRRNDEENDNPLEPLNASVGAARSAGLLG